MLFRHSVKAPTAWAFAEVETAINRCLPPTRLPLQRRVTGGKSVTVSRVEGSGRRRMTFLIPGFYLLLATPDACWRCGRREREAL